MKNLLSRRFVADERGISALLVAVSMAGLIGSASIAVDLGNLWTNRRHVIVASDAAALAAASDYAVRQDGCSTSAPDYVRRNAGDGVLTACQPVGNHQAGYVKVQAEVPVNYAFANAMGFADRTVSATTVAAWGRPISVRGLRPFGICKDDPAFKAWAANPTGASGAVRVPYTNNPTDCGNAPGNWGIIDLDNTNPISQDDIKRWIVEGYPGKVRAGNIGGDTGVISNSLSQNLDAVRGKRFPIPVFDLISSQGSNARFHLIGFVEIELVSYRVTGAEDQRYLEVKFAEMVTAGECCDPGAPDFGLRVIHICGVDADFDSSKCQ